MNLFLFYWLAGFFHLAFVIFCKSVNNITAPGSTLESVSYAVAEADVFSWHLPAIAKHPRSEAEQEGKCNVTTGRCWGPSLEDASQRRSTSSILAWMPGAAATTDWGGEM
jgi:hypothetical protein